MKENQNSELPKVKNTVAPEQKKTTPPTSQTKPHTSHKKPTNTSLPSSQKPAEAPRNAAPGTAQGASPAKKAAPRKHVRPLQTIGQTQRSRDEVLDEALDAAYDEFIETDLPASEEIPIDAPEVIQQKKKPTNLLQRMQMRREALAEKKMSAMEIIRRRSGFSDDDIEMIFELGYESELGRLVGYDNLKKLKYDHLHRMSRESNKRYRTAFGYCGEDSITPQNKSRTMSKYMYDRRFLIIRTILTAIALLVIMILDYPALIGGMIADFAASSPLLFPILSTCLMVAITGLSYRQFNAGIRSYFKTLPTPYSTLSVTVPLVLLYDLIAMITQVPMLHLNCVAVGAVLLLCICDIFRLTSEMRVFRILSANTPKTVLEPTEPRKKKLKQGKKLIKIINDDLDEGFYHVHDATLTVGFFRRFNEMEAAHKPFRILLTLPIVLGFLAGFIVALANGLADALNTFAAVTVLGLPGAACFGFFFPLSHANNLLTHANCALVGEEAVQEYNESKTVIFNDYRLCRAVSCSELSVREKNDDLRRDLKLAGILFRKIGGSLEEIGRATATKTPDPSVAFVRIADTGVEAVIDNQYHVIAGDANFLKKTGIRIPRETADRTLRRAANVGLLYFAVDGVLKLTYDIEYALDPRFEVIAERLADDTTSVAIQSYNPNLQEDFLEQIRYADAVPVRVIKPGKYESDAVLEISDTGAVSLGGEAHIVNPLYAAKKINKTRRLSFYMQAAAAAIAFLGTLVIMLISQQSILTPILFGGYYLAWILATAILSGVLVSRRTLYLKREK